MAFYGNSIDTKYIINKFIDENGLLERMSISVNSRTPGDAKKLVVTGIPGVPKFVSYNFIRQDNYISSLAMSGFNNGGSAKSVTGFGSDSGMGECSYFSGQISYSQQANGTYSCSIPFYASTKINSSTNPIIIYYAPTA